MKILYTDQAIQHLSDLRAWLYPRGRGGFRAVTLQIKQSLSVLKAHPATGRRTAEPDVRETVEPRYGFTISHTVEAERVLVMRVYNGRRASPEDTISQSGE